MEAGEPGASAGRTRPNGGGAFRSIPDSARMARSGPFTTSSSPFSARRIALTAQTTRSGVGAARSGTDRSGSVLISDSSGLRVDGGRFGRSNQIWSRSGRKKEFGSQGKELVGEGEARGGGAQGGACSRRLGFAREERKPRQHASLRQIWDPARDAIAWIRPCAAAWMGW